MMEIEGVIDFDIVKCVILIEEKHFDSEEHSLQETQQSIALSDVAEVKET